MVSKKPKPEEYRYHVAPHTSKDNYFVVTKTLRGSYVDEYMVQLTPGNEDRVYCNCPGFLVQKYPKPLHKHVLLAKAYNALGIRTSEMYQLEAKTNKVIHCEAAN